MRLERCSNGHFYDADSYPHCPHCENFGSVNNTVPLNEQFASVNILPTETMTTPGGSAANMGGETTIAFSVGPDGKEFAPVVGWMVCTKGKNRGSAFNIKVGQNFIGRDKGMDIRLADEPSVSRQKHTIIVFDPASNKFFALMGESHSLSYLNNALITSATELKKNDRLKVGEVELMFIPCCDESFSWTADDTQK